MRRIQDEIERYREMGVLDTLLYDHTTKRPIMDDRELKTVDTYAERFKAKSQTARAKAFGEVATPTHIGSMMVRLLEDETECFEGGGTFLEPCCGEAVFLAQPYEVHTGEEVPLEKRGGALDRKIKERTEEDFLTHLYRKLTEVYGYDIQADNVLVARINVLKTFEDYYRDFYGGTPPWFEMNAAAAVISRNIFRMDGLRKTVPGTGRPAAVFDWKTGEEIEFGRIGKEKEDLECT